MIDIEDCKKLVVARCEKRFGIGEIKRTNWGYIVGWEESILGLGPALVDGETGYVYLTSSQLKKQDEIKEFGSTMEKLQGKSLTEKEAYWLEQSKTFEIIPFF